MSKGEVPDYPDEGLGDDEVFGTEAPKDAVTKALGALSGKVSSEKAVSDAAMRAMFAKKAARTIHDSLKQKAKRMFIIVYIDILIWYRVPNKFQKKGKNRNFAYFYFKKKIREINLKIFFAIRNILGHPVYWLFID